MLAIRYLVSCLRSDELGGTLQETVAVSAMSTARASAEIQLLGNELHTMGLSMQPVATRRVRRAGAKVQLLVHVGLPHPARRSVTAQTESVPKSEKGCSGNAISNAFRCCQAAA
jgi:hypothetical protein